VARVPLAVIAAAAAVLVVVLPSRGQAPPGQSSSSQPARSQAPLPRPLTPAKLLAGHAAAAALSGPDVTPGQWVYRELNYTGESGQSVKASHEELWATADDATQVNYYNGSYRTYHRGRNHNGVLGMTGFFAEPASYSSLASLPAQPRALVTRLAEIGARSGTGEPAGCSQGTVSCTAFQAISELLTGYVMPPAVTSKLYQALGDIPGVSVISNVTDVAGSRGVAFRITLKGGYLELILNPSTYQLIATQGSFPGGATGSVAILRQALVSGPGVHP
jgi:hypothetical protein